MLPLQHDIEIYLFSQILLPFINGKVPLAGVINVHGQKQEHISRGADYLCALVRSGNHSH